MNSFWSWLPFRKKQPSSDSASRQAERAGRESSEPQSRTTSKSRAASIAEKSVELRDKMSELYHGLFPAEPGFDGGDYLYRLAEHALVLLEKHEGGLMEFLASRGLSTSSDAAQIPNDPDAARTARIQELAKQLAKNPALQSELSYRVDYTPSRWLVECETSEIKALRESRGRPTDDKLSARDFPYDWMYDNKVTGVCFSGGGIRSATLNLGILQGLALCKNKDGKPLLERVDYLSTVSGGGYIHEWLAAWIKRRKSLDDVRSELVPLPEKDSPPFHPAPIRWLRRYSNYLTPRKGMFSTDTWVAIAIWLRNTFLNQLVLISSLTLLLLAPHLFVTHTPPDSNLQSEFADCIATKTPASGTNGNESGIGCSWTTKVVHHSGSSVQSANRALYWVIATLVLVGCAVAATKASWDAAAVFALLAGLCASRVPLFLHLWQSLTHFPKAMSILALFCISVGLIVWEDSKRASVLFFLASALWVSRLVLVFNWFQDWTNRPPVLAYAAAGCFVLGVSTMAIALRSAKAYNDKGCGPARMNEWSGGGQGVAASIVLLHLLSALFLSRLLFVLGSSPNCMVDIYCAVFLLIFGANVWVALEGGAIRAFEKLSGLQSKRRLEIALIWLKGYGGLILFFSAVASAAATALFSLFRWTIYCGLPYWLSLLKPAPNLGPLNLWKLCVVVGPCLFLFVPFFSQVLLAGLIGRDFADWLREWLASVRAWSLLLGLAWIGWFGVALFALPVMRRVLAALASHAKIEWSAVIAWIATTAGSVLAGKSGTTSGTDKDTSKTAMVINLVAIVGPYVFIAGLVVIVAYTTDFAFAHTADYYRLLIYLLPLFIWALFGLRVDINEFSMHGFYRNRLTRCYLGATNENRNPITLTGFDECDVEDLQVAHFRPDHYFKYKGPFPIFCSTINLTFGEDLAWQERKAASFAFTPLYSGYHVGWTAGERNEKLSYNGYVPTKCYAYPNDGVNIATAVAISGAAVSPNWGYHSHPATAFLMTMFNVRLGWWLRNPRRSKFAGQHVPVDACYDPNERPSPKLPAWQLAKEMLGMVDDTSSFVYLTDGGHFENMGLYELIRRRCRFIVVCDAEEDGNCCFDGIGNAIGRCRVDFGVEIKLDLAQLRPQMNAELGYAVSKQHFVFGDISYPELTSKDTSKKGTILYIKSSLTGPMPQYPGRTSLPSEPGDIVNHKLRHRSFPNDSTANQWFDEETFESYRRLGIHIAEEIDACDVWTKVF
jgi:hypothetical protein